ncbi:MAG: PLP-dependent transferase [Rhodothermales bacterium]|nr:PLP-dependent transferase [Rhodothermales bacterium]MBO6779133.1 PLP-dependent transferase [Rhodothermales bacterium]
MADSPTRIATMLASAGCSADSETGALTPPVHFSTTFERAEDGSWPGGHVYARDSNPTRALFESTLAQLEGGGACAAFSSGMAASNALIMALCAGGHVVLPNDVYHGVRHLAHTVWRQWGLEITAVDYADDWTGAIRKNTKLIWIESPSNPLVQITDVEAVCGEAASRGIPTVVDSTWNTPVLMQPLRWGATFVLHSTTKYLGGHSDVLGGAVVAADPDGPYEAVRQVQKQAGAVMGPFAAWLTLRGLRSLGARMDLHCRNAAHVADFLEAHPAVSRVHYPGLPHQTGHEVARRQMHAFGGMLSFEVPGARQAAMAVAARMRTFRRATSLGGTESLVEHRASIEPEPPTSPEGLLRLSVGLEHIDDLLADLDQALAP